MSEEKKKTAREIIEGYDGPPVRIMEVCGTHTHEIFRLGIRKLLPKQVELISGPGCPVCVTQVGFIDEAVYLALECGVTICTFGDLVRVPGTEMSLAGAREKGAKVRIVYSPVDAEQYAKDHPEEQVVFLAVGFETTTPASCLAVRKASEDGLTNFALLVANKTMPGAYAALKGSADVFLYPGHVNAITGTELCESLVDEGVSGVVAGFTAKELLTALAVALVKFQEGKPFFVNAYPRVVTREGSREAQKLVADMMENCDTEWRGLGIIPNSGLRLKKEYQVDDGQIVPTDFLAALEGGFFAAEQEKRGTSYYQYCTAIPVGTLLAQTWNLDLVQKLGEMIGHEMELFGVTLWLAPGMNIHRNPLCGRNFEYYSEDPLLAGMMAASMTLGVQKVPGCGTTIKHYACNNQEDNRMGSDSILSERTLREIYLKGFEIAIKDAQPMSVMTSYNLINGVHAANCYDTCTKAARDEWGFAGAIMTDWTTTNVQIQGECTAAGCMRAGNDMVMPGTEEDHENIRKELKEGTLDIRELKRCIYNTVNIILQSNQYEDAVSYEKQFDGLGEWMTVK